MQIYYEDEQICLFAPDFSVGKMFPAHSRRQTARTSGVYWRKLSELKYQTYMSLDLTAGRGNLLGESYWEILSPWRGAASMLNTGVSPSEGKESFLSQILEAAPLPKYYLTKTACLGILRRAAERGKELPPQLKAALEIQAGVAHSGHYESQPVAFAANQRDEVRDLHDIAGALGAQPGMKQQTFVADGCLTPWDVQSRRIFEDRGTWPALYGGEGGGHGYVKTEPAECLTPWDTQQERIFTPDSKAPTLAGADGGGGRNPAGLLFAAGVVSKGNGDCFLTEEKHTSLTKGGGQAGQGYPCVMTAGFCAGASPTAGNIVYQEETSPTLKGAESGTNMVPSILCLNDQGGKRMDASENITGTLRADEKGHQPLVYENHGIDARYNGPYDVAPTLSARNGTGGNNLPLVADEPETYCIVGNIIDRKVENGGNGLGCQKNISYTLTGMDRHAVYARQRVDAFKPDDVASTQSARQHKDATDLVCQPTYQQTVGTIGYTDHKGVNNQFVSEDKCVVEHTNLIRRLTPLECERLQGFPDGWTDILDASDSARYKALGNSVAIPCVDYVLHGIALAFQAGA
ncbi:DNA cytosine methyltransferase [Oscillibacter sp.]|uniref:DNA cytosine methyltransferase n=1 Tax=Oscillibacter sp. TaxID=1945593 RepID=UPI0037C80C2C